MAKKIDWLYHRKHCQTCLKAEAHRGEVAVKETVDAAKVRYAPADVLLLLDGVDKLVAAKGAKVVEFNLKKDRPEDDVLLGHLIGPTGNLRAPTAKVGKTMMVGFHPEMYDAVLA
jgi:arsenate reductase-like glutaredoxin family protein